MLFWSVPSNSPPSPPNPKLVPTPLLFPPPSCRRAILFNSHTPAEVSDVESSAAGERVELGWGHRKFISYSQLGYKNYSGWISDYECEYLRDNSLRFRVITVVNTDFYSLTFSQLLRDSFALLVSE